MPGVVHAADVVKAQDVAPVKRSKKGSDFFPTLADDLRADRVSARHMGQVGAIEKPVDCRVCAGRKIERAFTL
jgi:hypothetical protein